MSTIDEIRSNAKSLREQKKYAEAVERYRTLWTEHRDACTAWDGWGYAHCLRKAGRPQEGLEVCREAYKAWPDFDRLRNVYGWCIYDAELKGRSDEAIAQDEARFLKAANAITQLVEPERYSPYVRTVFRVVDYYKSRPSYPANRILEWLDRLDPQQLSQETWHGTSSDGKPIEYASDKEKWYADRCKALFELGRFQECLNFGEQALAEFSRFHHDNDVWFRWRIALSKGELGNKEAALADLQSLLPRKRDWFVQHRIAQFMYELDRVDDALRYAVDAALSAGDLEYKWELFLLMGSILSSQSKLDEARKHVLLAARLRQEHEWKTPPALHAAIQELGVDLSNEAPAAALHKELKRYWKSSKLADMPHDQGVITNILANGKSGFIRGDGGQDYYFKARSFQGPRNRLQPGLRVKFHIDKNPQPDKRDIAVYIEEV